MSQCARHHAQRGIRTAVLDASSLEEGDQCVDRREQEGDHILIYANRPFEELTGYDEDEIL